MTGLVSNIQRYSVHDGPGIRTTVFLKGCPLTCWWCQNPESRSEEEEIVVVETRCIRCGECRSVCASGVAGGGACVRCGACVETCPTGARQRTGEKMTDEQVLSVVSKDVVFFDSSGGGVTFSGGEPLLQVDFLLSLLAGCREKGIRTAVDTSGHAPERDMLAIAEFTDLFLYDLKLMDDEKHRLYTGASNAGILENLRALGRVHRNIWIRIPVIPGINDDGSNLNEIARLAASIPAVRQVNLLPYHETGITKFERLGESYPLGHLDPPSPRDLELAAERFRAAGLPTKIGG
jgi:pyruvate formate lyase activating enzyme